MTRIASKSAVRLLLVVMATTCLSTVTSRAQEYLSTEDALTITGGTATGFLIGRHIKRFDSTGTLFWLEPAGWEKDVQRFLGGEYYPNKTNLFDRRYGGGITAAGAMLLLGSADLAYPQGDKGKTFVQDQFLFVSGLTATKAATDMTKGLFRRRRPMAAMYPEMMPQRAEQSFLYDHQSFASGHTSSAFFSMAFLNIRARSIMRSEMSPDTYKSWRWLPPTVCFSWASLVGWSRIDAYKHYLTDVAAGALIGWLMAELFTSFGEYKSLERYDLQTPQTVAPLFEIRLRW